MAASGEDTLPHADDSFFSAFEQSRVGVAEAHVDPASSSIFERSSSHCEHNVDEPQPNGNVDGSDVVAVPAAPEEKQQDLLDASAQEGKSYNDDFEDKPEIANTLAAAGKSYNDDFEDDEDDDAYEEDFDDGDFEDEDEEDDEDKLDESASGSGSR